MSKKTRLATAREAIGRVFSDTSQPMATTIDQLDQLAELANDYRQVLIEDEAPGEPVEAEADIRAPEPFDNTEDADAFPGTPRGQDITKTPNDGTGWDFANEQGSADNDNDD